MNDTEKLQKLREEKLKENEWRRIGGYEYCLGCGYASHWYDFQHGPDCWLEKEVDKLDEIVLVRKLTREIEGVLKMLERIRERLDR